MSDNLNTAAHVTSTESSIRPASGRIDVSRNEAGFV